MHPSALRNASRLLLVLVAACGSTADAISAPDPSQATTPTGPSTEPPVGAVDVTAPVVDVLVQPIRITAPGTVHLAITASDGFLYTQTVLVLKPK
jgi:hypothetical protein